MKKNFFSIIISLITIFVFYDGVNAACYEKCNTDTYECGYYRTCETGSVTSCTLVDETKCGLIKCGNIASIPKKIPELTSYIIKIIYIAVPVILVLMGTIDLFKGVTSQKDDEIKKGQQMFIKRLIIGAIIFFVVMISKFFISIVADSDNSNNISDCIDCFIDGDCD